MSATVVRVSRQWLALRESADAAARSAELAGRLAQCLPSTAPFVVHDLGGGSGAMARWLAPRLPGRQRWVVHDRDADLLELVVADPPGRALDGSAVAVEARLSDITRLTSADLAGASLVVASALLDLLTSDQLAGLLSVCAAVACPVLLALTVIGRVTLTPADPLDAPIAEAFNRHQRRNGLLGPDAVGAAVEQLAAPEVVVRPSPWRLDADDADLSAAWLDGWLAAAGEQEPVLLAEAGAYRERRLRQLARGQLRVTVDHADLLVLP
jgi:hypothetical protein